MYSQENFKLCNPDTTWYYFMDGHAGNRYTTESKVVKEVIIKMYKPVVDTTQNGIITFQFMVNCNGKVGMFKTLQMDTNYKDFQFRKEIVDSLFSIIKNLNVYKLKMNPRTKEPYDYLIYFSFKIYHGKIVGIMP